MLQLISSKISVLRKYLQCFWLCVKTSAYRAPALYKRLQTAWGSPPSTMAGMRSLCFLAVALAGKYTTFVFCRRVQKQNIDVIMTEKLLKEVTIFHVKGENRHGTDSTWGDCGRTTELAYLEICPSPTVYSALGHQHRQKGISGIIQLVKVTYCSVSFFPEIFTPAYQRLIWSIA